MQLNITIFFVLLCGTLHAQDCTKYKTSMDAGESYLNKGNYDEALNKFQLAQIAARECGLKTNEPAQKLKMVLKGLKQQRDEAIKGKVLTEKAKEAALRSEAETKRALITVDSARLRADSAKVYAVQSEEKARRALDTAKVDKQRADSALALASKLVRTIYFYDGKFALSVREIFGDYKYGFVNKEGDVVINYKYDQAEQFDRNTGFAKVKRTNNNSHLINFLIDTTGKEYQLAFDRLGLNEFVTAVDLSYQGLNKIPETVVNNTQLQILILNANHIKRLPSAIGQLTALQTLYLSGNKLVTLPSAIGQLEALQSLYF